MARDTQDHVTTIVGTAIGFLLGAFLLGLSFWVIR
jgi:tetrahydromethanopterin S-methyltransferase subunit F